MSLLVPSMCYGVQLLDRILLRNQDKQWKTIVTNHHQSFSGLHFLPPSELMPMDLTPNIIWLRNLQHMGRWSH